MRRKLGESLASVQKYDVPPKNVTTGSLEALQALQPGRAGAGHETRRFRRHSAIPAGRQPGPEFRHGICNSGSRYSNMGETARGAENLHKAYELRERVSRA